MSGPIAPKAIKRWLKRQLRRWYEARPSARSIAILMLHEVHPLGFSPREFEALLMALSGRVDFLRLDEVGSLLRDGRSVQRDAVVLTFDDGLRNNLVYAYPLLRRYDAKATMFVVPGLIDAGRWLWTHELFARLVEMPSRRLPDAEQFGAGRGSGAGSEARREWAREMVEWAKSPTARERDDLLAVLRASAPDLLKGHSLEDRYALMDWEEIGRLDPELVEIGSHSYSHPMLRALSSDALKQEVRASRDVIEARTGRGVQSFCYPNGVFDQDTLDLVRVCYRQAVTVDEGLVPVAPDLFRLPRVYVWDPEDTLFRMARARRRKGRAGEVSGTGVRGEPG